MGLSHRLIKHHVVKLGHVYHLGLRMEASLLHVEAYLLGYFSQDLLGEVAEADAVVEAYELDNVTGCNIALHVTKEPVVTIELLHAAEVSVAHTDNDDTRRTAGSCHDCSDRLLHVCNLTISDEHQNLVLLVLGVEVGMLREGVDDRCKASRPRQPDVLQSTPVAFKDASDGEDARV